MRRKILGVVVSSLISTLACGNGREPRPGAPAPPRERSLRVADDINRPLTRSASDGHVGLFRNDAGWLSDAGTFLDAGGPVDSTRALGFEASRGAGRYVVLVSLDGVASRFVDELLSGDELPTFAALRKRAAWTHDARTTPGTSVTLPSHFSMITSRPATNEDQFSPGRAHGLLLNATLPVGETIHSYGADPYVPSVFDVVHDHGGRTGLFASKEKFRALAEGYGPVLGLPDPYPGDYGQNKLDTVSVVDGASAPEVVSAFIDVATVAPLNLSFLHLRDTDDAGHFYGWGSQEYLEALKDMDSALGALLGFLDSTAPYKDTVHLLVTTDHGGVEFGHTDHTNPHNFTIPFYLVSPTIAEAGDLYQLAGDLRAKPPADRYALAGSPPPIRNSDVGNLCTTLLELPEIPNSTMHSFHLRGRWPFRN